MPFLILLSLFVFVPILEISVLIKVAGGIGLGSTILLVIATAILGAFLVKQQGFETLRNAQSQMARGKMPAMELAEGIALLIAGALLLTPGFITDTIGFCCLTPPLRRAAILWLTKNGILQASAYTQSHHQDQKNDPHSRTGNIIEGEYRNRD